MKKLLDGYRSFYNGTPARKGFCALRAERLAHSQHPHSMVISCFDSRVCPEAIFGTNDGHICVHRNMLGKVDDKDYSMMASLRFAAETLSVQNIIILGHSDCNAVKKLQELDTVAEDIRCWLALSPISYQGKTLDEAVRNNVLSQLAHLREIDFIGEAVGNGSLHIEGMFFHIETGLLERYDDQEHTWQTVPVEEAVVCELK